MANSDENEHENENDGGSHEEDIENGLLPKEDPIISLAKLVRKGIVSGEEFGSVIKRMKSKNEEIAWSLKQELILKSLGEKSCCYYLLHRDESDRYRKFYTTMMMHIFWQTMFASILMFISSAFQGSNARNLYMLPLSSGILNLILAFQQKVLEFAQPERFMLEHASTSRAFRELYDDIQIQLSLARKEREPMPGYLLKTVTKYKNEKKTSPYIDRLSYKDFKRKYLLKKADEEGSKGSVISSMMRRRDSKDKIKYSMDDIDVRLESDANEILNQKKYNGIPEDVIGVTPIDISEQDIKLSQYQRKLDLRKEKCEAETKYFRDIQKIKKKYSRELQNNLNYDSEDNISWEGSDDNSFTINGVESEPEPEPYTYVYSGKRNKKVEENENIELKINEKDNE